MKTTSPQGTSPQGTDNRIVGIVEAGASHPIVSGKWIVEAGELEGRMSRAGVTEFKACLSRQFDKFTVQGRQFVIVGTTSETDYLRDPTEGR